jgi:hypothetical protein
MGRTFWSLATEVMVKILQACFSRQRCAREDRVDLKEGRKDSGTIGEGPWRSRIWIQENTELDYGQREYGKNVLVVDDGGNGDNSPAMLFKATMCEGRSSGFERR